MTRINRKLIKPSSKKRKLKSPQGSKIRALCDICVRHNKRQRQSLP